MSEAMGIVTDKHVIVAMILVKRNVLTVYI